MKLILCLVCHDVYKLTREGRRSCECGKTWGLYLEDGISAQVSNNHSTTVLGFHNGTLLDAILKQRDEGNRADGLGHRFTAFLMPTNAPNVERIDE